MKKRREKTWGAQSAGRGNSRWLEISYEEEYVVDLNTGGAWYLLAARIQTLSLKLKRILVELVPSLFWEKRRWLEWIEDDYARQGWLADKLEVQTLFRKKFLVPKGGWENVSLSKVDEMSGINWLWINFRLGRILLRIKGVRFWNNLLIGVVRTRNLASVKIDCDMLMTGVIYSASCDSTGTRFDNSRRPFQSPMALGEETKLKCYFKTC